MGGIGLVGNRLIYHIERTIIEDSEPSSRARFAISEARKQFSEYNKQLDINEWDFSYSVDDGKLITVGATPKDGRTFLLLSPQHFGRWYELPKSKYEAGEE